MSLLRAATTTADRDQARALADRHGTVLVLGGPGTGRTTVCLERVAQYLAEGGQLDRAVLLTHSRGAAQELRNALLARVGGAHLAPRVTTVHALAARIVSEHAEQPLTLLTAPEQEFRIRELLAGTDLSGWPEHLRAGAGTARFASDLRVLAAAIRQEGRDPADLAELGARYDIAAWRVLGPFLSDYLDVLDLEQTIDYAEAVHRARILLTRPDVLASVTATMSLLVVDEFGESDPSQAALLAGLTRGGVPTLLALDPDQTAFEFRGAVPDRLEELSGLFPDLSVHHLRADHRCAGRVHDAVEQIRDRLPLVPAAPPLRRVASTASRSGGEVICMTQPSAARAVRALAEQLRRAHLHDGVDWSQMAVITRHGSEIAALAAVLATEGVPVHRSKEEVTLSGVHAVQALLVALEAAAALSEGRTPGPGLTTALIGGPLSGLDQAVCHRIDEWARAHRVAALDWTVLTDTLLGEAVDPEAAVTPGLARACRPARDMVRRITAAGTRLAAGGEVHEALWTLWGATSWSAELRDRALAGDATADRELDGMCSLFDLAERTSTLTGAPGARRLIRSVREETIPADRSRESDRDRLGVSLITAHRAKGRQFRVVAVSGLEEGGWPAPNHTGSLVSADQWSPDGPVPPPGWPETVRAERRLLLLACSRAADLLILTAVDDPNGGVTPSPFFTEIAEAFGTQPAVGGRATRMTDLVGELRRVALAPASSPALRDQACGLLTDLVSRGVSQADPAHWWRLGWSGEESPHAPEDGRHITDRHITETAPPSAQSSSAQSSPAAVEPVRLSASHVGELLTCPRQWFLTRRGGAAGVRGPRAGVGSLVHRVAAETMADGWSLERAEESLREGWPQLEFEIGWQSPVEEQGARQALERLDRWLEGRPGTLVGTEVAFDHTFHLPSGPVRFRGSIDRLERDETGRLVVVDLKAGTSSSAQAARSHLLQVGVYQAVVAAGGVAMVPDPAPVAVGGAELVYLRRGAGRGGADPKIVRQPSLADVPWPEGEERPADGRTPDWIHARIDEAAAIAASGQLRAVPNPGCPFCPVRIGCPALVPPDDVIPEKSHGAKSQDEQSQEQEK
ncbi:MAG: ATP-dependent helicase [Acidipropionibacterium sp.]|jgi:superfamily I DNA/RNA helicase/RecB family exonuclease|nr:ATP-dependent helicase [Acidipropionibacterium sp.]